MLTFGAYSLTFEAQELIGGTLSLIAVAMVTWMIFWMQKAGRTLKRTLEGGIDRALARGTVWGLIVLGFVSVAREGIETTLLLWSMVQSFGDAPSALLGALLGILTAGGPRLAARPRDAAPRPPPLLHLDRRLPHHRRRRRAGVRHPRPAGGRRAPRSLLRVRAHRTRHRAPSRSARARFPFGWAFDVSAAIPPGSPLAAILQATIGFTPRMSWLQIIAWVLYVGIVGSIFCAIARPPRPAAAPGRRARPDRAADRASPVARFASAVTPSSAASTPSPPPLGAS